jgi:O-antigen/teichoic acid export membrane protein
MTQEFASKSTNKVGGQGTSLLGASSIYAIGLGINRLIDFALLPLYTNYFDPGEFGAAALTLTLIGFGHVIYAMGFGPAFIRYFGTHDESQRRRMFTSSTLALLAVALVLSALVCDFAPTVGEWFGLGDRRLLIDLAAGVLLLDVLTLLPYSVLRSQGRAGTFTVCTFFTTIVHVGLTAGLILGGGYGVEAIFVAMVVSSLLNVVIVGYAVRQQFSFERPLLFPGELLRFGLPFVPAGLATVAVELIDRVILDRLMDEDAVGIYSAGYRIAAGMGLLVKAFEYAWAPYLMERRSGVHRVTKGAGIGFLSVAGILWMIFWFFGEELLGLRIFGVDLMGTAYRTSVSVIPTLMFAYILAGIAEIMMAGVYVNGRSGIVPVAAIAAAAANIIGNYALIPSYGMMGAAYATVIAYAVLATSMFLYTRHILIRADGSPG